MDTTAEYGYWSGIAEIIPMPGNLVLEGACGAYVYVVGLARSETEFVANVEAALSAMDFDLLEMTEREVIPTLERWSGADDGLRERCSSLSLEHPIELGTFHAFRD